MRSPLWSGVLCIMYSPLVFAAPVAVELRTARDRETDAQAAAAAAARAAEDAKVRLNDLNEKAERAAAEASAAATGTDLAAAKMLRAKPEREKNAQAEAATFGNQGVSLDPQWDLLASAALTTIDADQPLLSLGAQYNSPYSLLRLVIRRNLNDDVVAGAPGSAAFGHAVLSPALGAYSAAFRLERILVWEPKLLWGRFARFSPRYYFNVEASRARFDVSYTSDTGEERTLSKTTIPASASAGVAFKLDGNMPGDASFAGSKLIVVEPYFGPTFNVFGGDFNSKQRTLLWNKRHDARYFFGLELGAFLQFGGVIAEPKITWLGPVGDDTNLGDDRVNGLTSVQFELKVAFVLPWTVVGGQTPPSYVAADEAAAAQEEADEKRQRFLDTLP